MLYNSQFDLRLFKYKKEVFEMNFVAIDFETANKNMTSACSVGIAIVKNNQITDIKEWYIKPTPFHFDYYNTKVHGITGEDVKNSPTFKELWNEIYSYIQDNTLVAHNAPFDMSVLKHLVEFYDLDAPCYEYFCSCELSRNVWSEFENHKLGTVCKNLDINLNHHNAASDAAGCAQIVLTAYDALTSFNKELDEKITFCNIKNIEYSNYVKPKSNFSSRTKNHIVYSNLCTSASSFNKSHPFYNKDIVFTGDLCSIDRRDAIQRVLDLGAKVKSCVSKNTTYLVVGAQDKSIVGDDGLSTKQEKAYHLINKGIEIKVIEEDEFLKLIS